MKIRGIEIAIGVSGYPTRVLGVVPIDIEVPEELTKTDWTPLEVQTTVITGFAKSVMVHRIHSTETEFNFRIDHNMIAAAAAELQRRIDAQRVQLCQPGGWTQEMGLQALGAVQDALSAAPKPSEEGSRG